MKIKIHRVKYLLGSGQLWKMKVFVDGNYCAAIKVGETIELEVDHLPATLYYGTGEIRSNSIIITDNDQNSTIYLDTWMHGYKVLLALLYLFGMSSILTAYKKRDDAPMS